jgi:hypothetical protein
VYNASLAGTLTIIPLCSTDKRPHLDPPTILVYPSDKRSDVYCAKIKKSTDIRYTLSSADLWFDRGNQDRLCLMVTLVPAPLVLARIAVTQPAEQLIPGYSRRGGGSSLPWHGDLQTAQILAEAASRKTRQDGEQGPKVCGHDIRNRRPESPWMACLPTSPAAVGCIIRTTLKPDAGFLVGAQCAPYDELLVGTPQLEASPGRLDKAIFI